MVLPGTSMKKRRDRKRSKAALKRQKAPPREIDIEDAELLSKEQKTKIRNNKVCSIRVTGKRRRKMTKRLKHLKKDKEAQNNDVTMEETTQSTKKSKTKKASEKLVAMDVDT